MPRYGWETEERIIMPSEVYTEDVARELFELAVGSLRNVINFFCEFKDLPADLSTAVDQLRGLVEDASRKLR